MRFRIFEAWGFGTALFLSEIYPVLNVNGLSAYHNSSVTASTLLTALLGMVLGAIFFLVIFHSLPHSDFWKSARLILAALLPLMVMLTNRYAITFILTRLLARWHHQLPPPFVEPLNLYQALAIELGWILLIVVLFRWQHGLYNVLLSTCRVVLVTAGIMGILATFDLFRALQVHKHDHDFQAYHQHDPNVPHPRVVWIILDELSYNQAFEHRAAGLDLPNLDALAAQSDVYTHVEPVAFFTDLAVPSLLAGEPVDALHYTFASGARFHFQDTNTYHQLDIPRTLIGQAQANDWNVGIVGWWNPYCMLFAGQTQSCRWLYTDWSYGRMRSKYNSLQNFQHWAHGFYRQSPGVHLLKVRIAENQDLYAWSQDLLHDDKMDFVLLHLTPPHAPYVYDRHTGKDTVYLGASYLDGLALADKTLGGLMQTIESSPRWKDTTVIVQGDHSWRTAIWQSESWTEEDAKASNGGQFDNRPALLVHHAGQTTQTRVAEPTPLLHVHDMIQSMVAKK